MNHLDSTRLALLHGKTWRYLRYLQFRDALLPIVNDIETICVCGAGHGMAELAIALEFPHLKLTLTDHIAPNYPNYHKVMSLAWKYGVDNMRFTVWNVLEPTERRFDLVASTEMLEHIRDAKRAVANMRSAATKYVYCLVPFADDTTNGDLRLREVAWDKNEHFVFGYAEKSLRSLFGHNADIRGSYWSEGRLLREELTKLQPNEITARFEALCREAEGDLHNSIPDTLKQALGIRVLAKADDTVDANPILPPTLNRLRERIVEQDAA